MKRAPLAAIALAIAAVAACTRALPAGSAPMSSADASVASIADEDVAIPSGIFVRGSDAPERTDEAPAHRVELSAFYIDRTLVTRRAFLAFADAAHYVTDAERAGYGMGAYEGMGDWEWERMPHASFRRPFREGTPEADAFLHPDAPAVMVTWNDAHAYCSHFEKRLPSEAEWEYAMRAGANTRYPWGTAPERDGKLALNFWQGESHAKNLRLDGFLYVSPVRAFAANAWGVFDPVGNVWQWTDDVYARETYPQVAARARTAERGVAFDPHGPSSGDKHVLRGGSWWCGTCTCDGYGLSYRGKAASDAAFNNNGFRCARSRSR